jgi:hypothetical protein
MNQRTNNQMKKSVNRAKVSTIQKFDGTNNKNWRS